MLKPRPALRAFSVLAFLTVFGLAAAGCDIIGYGQSGFAGSWQTVQDIDEATGQTRTAVITTTKANTIWGWVLSLLGKPSFSVACLGAGNTAKASVTIDWRTAIGIPGQKRNVQVRIDNAGDLQRGLWTVNPGGRSTSLQEADAERFLRHMAPNKASIWAQTVTPRGAQTLVFNIRGFDLAGSALSCL